MNEIFNKMFTADDEEFSLMGLISMLCDDDVCDEIFERFRKRLVG